MNEDAELKKFLDYISSKRIINLDELRTFIHSEFVKKVSEDSSSIESMPGYTRYSVTLTNDDIYFVYMKNK